MPQHPEPDDLSGLDVSAHEAESAYLHDTRWSPRLRCALRALADLGVSTPGDWITLDDDGNAIFAPMSAGLFDRLVCLLEDLAEQRPVNVTVARTGPTLFDPGTPEDPTTPTPAPSTVHPVIASVVDTGWCNHRRCSSAPTMTRERARIVP